MLTGIVIPDVLEKAEAHSERNGGCPIVTLERQDGMELARCLQHELVWYTRLAMDKLGLHVIHGQWPE